MRIHFSVMQDNTKFNLHAVGLKCVCAYVCVCVCVCVCVHWPAQVCMCLCEVVPRRHSGSGVYLSRCLLSWRFVSLLLFNPHLCTALAYSSRLYLHTEIGRAHV